MSTRIVPAKPYWKHAPRGRWARDTYPAVPWRPNMSTGRVALSPWIYASGKTPDGRDDPLCAYITDGALPDRAADRARFRAIVGLTEHRGCPDARKAGEALSKALKYHEASRNLPAPTRGGGLFGLMDLR